MAVAKPLQAAYTEVDKRLRQICPYSVYRNTLPPNLSPKLQGYFSLLTDYLHKDHPASITTVVATQYHSDERDPGSPHSVHLHTFGRFRKTYSAITQMSFALADLYLEIPILPLISPVFAKDWERQVSGDGTLHQEISRNGLLCYSSRTLF
jgi:hypothetical protein